MFMRHLSRVGLLGLSLALLGGCSGGGTGDPKVDPKVTSKTDGTKGDTNVAPQAEQSAEQFARAFLDSLGAEKASTEVISPAFKRLIAPPLFDDDKAIGFSKDNLQKWLAARGRGLTFIESVVIPLPSGKGQSLRGDVKGTEKPERFALRVEKNAEGVWQVTWFSRTTTTGEVPSATATSDLLRARDTAQDFLDAVTGGEGIVAEGIMKKSLKEDLGGSPNMADKAKGLTYDEAFLRTKLKRYGSYIKYTIAKQEMTPGSTFAMFSGELSNANDKLPFTIKVSKDDAGLDWMIEEFKE